MNNSLLLLIAIAVSPLGAQTPVIADDNPILSAKQVADLLLSPDRDAHRRGVKYVFDNKPNLTSQISRLIGGLSSDNRLVASACAIGISHGSWDPKAIEEHVPQLIELLSANSAAARRGAYTALNRIASSLRDRIPELIAKAAQDSMAMNSILTISKNIGLNNRQWIEAWLPLATSENTNIRDRCRYEIQSVRKSSRILIQLIETDQPDSVLVAILETLASYRQKPKGAGKLAIRMLCHRSSKVRAVAIASLDEIPHAWSSSREDLLRIARTDDEELRAAATRRLFSDPRLGKTREEMGIEEKQVARELAQRKEARGMEDLVRDRAASRCVLVSRRQVSW